MKLASLAEPLAIDFDTTPPLTLDHSADFPFSHDAHEHTSSSWHDASLCADWTVICGDRVYHLERQKLAEASGFFNRLFNSPFQGRDSLNATTELFPDADPKWHEAFLRAFEIFLDFAYTGVFQPQIDSLVPLATLLDFLDAPTLQEQLQDILVSAITDRNCSHFLEDGFELHSTSVVTQCEAVIAQTLDLLNPVEVSQRLDSLPFDSIINVFDNDHLSCSSEDVVFHAMLEYLATHTELSALERKDLLSTIRFCELSPAELTRALSVPDVPHALLAQELSARTMLVEQGQEAFDKYIKSQRLPETQQHRLCSRPSYTITVEWTEAARRELYGVCHWLATDKLKAEFSSPLEKSLISLTSSPVFTGNLRNLVSPMDNNLCFKPVAGAFVALQFNTVKVKPTHYSVRHSSTNAHSYFMRSWKFQGSLDGESWVDISTHDHDDSMSNSNLSPSFAVSCPSFFTHFRILSTGPNSSNNGYLMLSGLEVYGMLRGK
jgi:hypothetical protein